MGSNASQRFRERDAGAWCIPRRNQVATTHRDLAVGVPKQCVEMGVGILRALATSLTIEPDDFDCAQFSQRGSSA